MTNIDETELARLEELAGKAKPGAFAEKNLFNSLHVDGYGNDNAAYIAAISKIGPALVAEIRRLRRNYECSEKSLQRHEHMVAELMEKVEAWEWFGECRSLILWRGPEDEMMEIFNAAREAVHADRE